MVCNKTRISYFENSQHFPSNRRGRFARETTVKVPVHQIQSCLACPCSSQSDSHGTQNDRRHPCGRTNDGHGADLPVAVKRGGHGVDTHPWPLRLSICAARGTSTDKTDQANGTDGCTTHRFIAHPYQSSRAAAVVELRAAKEWINHVRRRKRLSCRSPGALTAGAHPRW